MTTKTKKFASQLSAPTFQATGGPGANNGSTTLAGSNTSGAPTSGAHVKGEIASDDSGKLWYCTVAGTPGTWVQTPGTTGVGTPNTARQSLSATVRTLITGTSIALPTGSLRGSGSTGSWFRFRIGLNKTAAGTAVWTAIVAFGVNNTTSDAAIATFTSGTNTATGPANGLLEIDCIILTTGATATAGCMASFPHDTGANTGIGSMDGVPGSTATFDSTVTSPFIHVDITSGTGSTMTASGTAEVIR